jgi:hypothetical protein
MTANSGHSLRLGIVLEFLSPTGRTSGAESRQFIKVAIQTANHKPKLSIFTQNKSVSYDVRSYNDDVRPTSLAYSAKVPDFAY